MSDESSSALDCHALLDGFGQGVLIFDAMGTLIFDNWAARKILGKWLGPIHTEGWPALVRLALDTQEDEQPSLDALREQALRSGAPLRLHIYSAGAYIPCWVAAVYSTGGQVLTLLTLERPDWGAITDLLALFRNETRMSLSATRGHAELVRQILRRSDEEGVDTRHSTQRVMGFAELIATHMLRLQSLTNQLQRLEVIRTGALRRAVRDARRTLQLTDFVEDFLEEFADEAIADPDIGGADFRDRLAISIPAGLQVYASPAHLANALHDTLRNAASYSPPRSPIQLHVYPSTMGTTIQFDVIDQGCGIRVSERERVFAPFERARQPQIIGVDGYGLSLYLTRIELEAMGGSIWFTSTEGKGTTVSFRLPRRPLNETAH